MKHLSARLDFLKETAKEALILTTKLSSFSISLTFNAKPSGKNFKALEIHFKSRQQLNSDLKKNSVVIYERNADSKFTINFFILSYLRMYSRTLDILYDEMSASINLQIA